ncbi:hypothetical protein BOTBODRAFT_146701 [Botryobasidium botryosum FD-172 SS1]|uniref:Uncharacterized protein n=1 Tax=Botryobasidium botryosum (strain FD-172 SS1) TaxID=930990 RepID=A0A067MKU1_BOTB1|nr:hypothetical protein BOTBODRAFT_146701 [Botryobasidium botryosum FD-172 SS1]
MKTFADEKWQEGAKIVVAFDIGTTQDGRQTIHRVNNWPGQGRHNGSPKIPSVVWYDANGNAQVFGAQAQKIYSDFLGYLYRHARDFFGKHILNGDKEWHRLESAIEFVITHPNGWRLQEQALLRHAAVAAGLVSTILIAQKRVHFVTEAEASVHFVTVHADLQVQLQIGAQLIVCDAGGSTVDTTLYKVVAVQPRLRLEEMKASACIQAGSIFVNEYAKNYIQNKLQRTKLGADRIEAYTAEFLDGIEDNKKDFHDPEEDILLELGERNFTDKELGVERGMLTLAGTQMQRWFDPLVEEIVASVEDQLRGHSAKHLFLVGGFGDSCYLQGKLKSARAILGANFVAANETNAKAVADGAVIWFVKNAVSARATRFAFGTKIIVPSTPLTPEKLGRAIAAYPGGYYVTGGWSQITHKGKVIANAQEHFAEYTLDFSTAHPTAEQLAFKTALYAYDRPGVPMFLLDVQGTPNRGFEEVCAIQADLTAARNTIAPANGPFGRYWRLHFRIVLKFGGTELTASVQWKQKKKMRTGPVSIVPAAYL